MAFSSIPGSKFSVKDGNCWLVNTINYNAIDSIVNIRKIYETDFSTEAEEALEKAVTLLKENSYLSDASYPTFDVRSIITWDIPFEPYPIQLAGIEYMMKNRKCFNGDDMGLGKTMQTIISLELTRGENRVVVVCPNVAVNGWRREIDMWSNNATSSNIDKNGIKNPDADYIVINYESFHKHSDYLSSVKNIKCLVIDESHMIKNSKSKRVEEIRKVSKKCDIIYLLSGTILENRAYDFVSQLQIMQRINDFGGQGSFIMRYCAEFENGRINRSESKNLDELNNNLRRFCMVRRLKEQLEKELPEKFIKPIRFTMKNSEDYDKASADISHHLMNKKIDSAKKQYSLFFSSGKEEEHKNLIDMYKNEEEMYLQVIEELKYLSALGKVENVLAYVDKILKANPTNKIIIFANRIDLQEIYAKRIENSISISGGMSPVIRSRNEKIFMENPDCRVIVCSQKAANSAITLTSANFVIVTEFAWTYSIHSQEFDRAYRIGQQRDVNCYFMISRNTVDELAYKIIMDKKEIMDKSLNGREDESVAKSVINDIKQWLRDNNVWI
jgi:SWI/SNF-related matrix-associated actin-dependent regulator 1 of chromatin subfamily A